MVRKGGKGRKLEQAHMWEDSCWWSEDRMDRMRRETDSSIKYANTLISATRPSIPVVLSFSPQDSCTSRNRRTAGDTEP